MENNDFLEIKISGTLYISTFEKILNQYYRESLNKNNIVFDLRRLEWTGFFPASLFFSWVKHLNGKKNINSIKILLPERASMPSQVRKVLLGYRILSQLNDAKVNIPYYSDEFPHQGIPLSMPKSFEKVTQSYKYEADDYIQRLNLQGSESQSVKDAFDVIIYELLENIYVHANRACPHYGVAHTISSGRKSSYAAGFMTVFDKGVPYIEIMLGDLGTGINNKLKKFIKNDFTTYFNLGKNNRKEERILTYAFDFFSTSDEEGRKKRIIKLIDDKEIEIKISEIATGLFCVLQAAKSNQGQLVVRTPQAILGFDFYKNPNNLHISGKNDLGLKSLAPLPGTHYLLRIPLIHKTTPRVHETSPGLHEQREFDFNKTGLPQVLAPFDAVKTKGETHYTIYSALKKVNEHLSVYRQHEGISLIMPPPTPLISRAILIFLVGLNAMAKGKRTLIWCNPRVFSLFPVKNSSSLYNSNPKFIAGSVYAGDLMLNKFLRLDTFVLDEGEKANAPIFSVAQNTIRVLRYKYISNLVHHLRNILKKPEVLHVPGPFFIVGKYYTGKYYEIPKALNESIDRRRFAEWCFVQCPEIPDIIIATTGSLKPLADEIAGIMEENGKKPEVFEFSESNISGGVSSYKNKEKTGVILADVICRGKTVRDLLSWANLLKIDKIITLIDARSKENLGQEFFHISTGKQKKLTPVIALLNDSIEIHNKPIKSEKIFVIDPKTGAPTLYLRESREQIALLDMLKGPAKEADALFSGHCEYKEKHYSHFLHLPKLINALSLQIEYWIKEQVDYVEKQSHGEDRKSGSISDSWHVLLCNPEIRWIETFLKNLLPDVKIEKVDRAKLLAPGIPSDDDQKNQSKESSTIPSADYMADSDHDIVSRKQNWLIFHSAIATGETARLSIEFVSRKAPDSILLLCFMGRMDPHHRTFFDGVGQYRNALLYFGIFLNFPIGAYPVIGENCPMCAVNKRLDGLLKMTLDILRDKDSHIGIAIQDKISANKHIVLEYGEGKDNIKKILSDHSMKRAYYRALYEGARYEIPMRDELYTELNKHKDSIDRFLEVISMERLSPIFKEEELKNRLMNSKNCNVFHEVQNRLYEILEKEKPPFQVGRVIGAIIHIIPYAFIAKAVDMIKRFIDSYTDVKEICIGLLLINALPYETEDIRAFCRHNKHPKTEKLFSETVKLIEMFDKVDAEDSVSAIRKIKLLQHRLIESSDFSSGSECLSGISSNNRNNIKWEKIEEYTNRLCGGWRRDVSPLLTEIYGYNLWPKLAKRHPDLASSLNTLDNYTAKLSNLFQSFETISNPPNSKIIEAIFDRSIKIDNLRKKVGHIIINDLCVDITKCYASFLPEVLSANNGGIINISKEIDYDVPLVFCDLRVLNSIIDEIIKNWKKHKKDKKNSKAWFKIYKENKMVCLEFGDNIPGDFNLESEGGLRMIQEFCDTYGCYLVPPDKTGETGEKMLKILLHEPRFS